ncbi:hypothetical protein I549_0501 [Mycobacterium avium subsp. avium 2285 (R)]|nr:hypothetical protein I549_6145 [Mycobacterium avium subsp. avium 2285 (R)]EUA41331.1 hypothetical protein I549_0501 [Mycobacterium avium subsp. avium 2285 (R)]
MANDIVLQEAGWTSLRVWEHVPVDEAVSRIEKAYQESK